MLKFYVKVFYAMGKALTGLVFVREIRTVILVLSSKSHLFRHSCCFVSDSGFVSIHSVTLFCICPVLVLDILFSEQLYSQVFHCDCVIGSVIRSCLKIIPGNPLVNNYFGYLA